MYLTWKQNYFGTYVPDNATLGVSVVLMLISLYDVNRPIGRIRTADGAYRYNQTVNARVMVEPRRIELLTS